MSRKPAFVVPPEALTGRVGLAVAEMQVVHHGHADLIHQMTMICDTVVVALGSCQLHGVPGHPFPFEQRKEMLQILFGDRLKFLALEDIDASVDTDDWWTYVASRIRSNNLPEPTDFFTGSAIDARFYTKVFATLDDPATTTGRVTTRTSPRTGRRLHLLDRDRTPELKGREIRFLIESRDESWKAHVPQRLWGWIERHYPPQLRVAFKQAGMLENVPVGTRWKPGRDEPVQVLRADGKWRPMRDGDEDRERARREARMRAAAMTGDAEDKAGFGRPVD